MRRSLTVLTSAGPDPRQQGACPAAWRVMTHCHHPFRGGSGPPVLEPRCPDRHAARLDFVDRGRHLLREAANLSRLDHADRTGKSGVAGSARALSHVSTRGDFFMPSHRDGRKPTSPNNHGPAPDSRLQVRLLGPLEVTVGARTVELTTGRLRTLIVALALSAGRPVTVDQLTKTVWGQNLPLDVRRTLSTYMTRLRTALGAESVVFDPTGYVLRVSPDDVDALRFNHLLDAAARPSTPRGKRSSRTRPWRCGASSLSRACNRRGWRIPRLRGWPSVTCRRSSIVPIG